MRKLALLALALLGAALVFGFAHRWTVYRDVKYGLTQEEAADLYLLDQGVHPAIVMIHGGGWQGGDKTHLGGYYANAYALAGFNVVTINYRLAKHGDRASQWNAQLQDAQLAMRWLRRNAEAFHIDPTRIAVMGQSAGAQLALFLGSVETTIPGDRANLYAEESPKAAAVIDAFGPTDLTQPDMASNLTTLAVFGARSYAEASTIYEDASPLRTINARSAPTCIVHGLSDAMIPHSQAALLAQKLRRLGVPHHAFDYEGGHAYEGLTLAQRLEIEFRALRCIRDFLS